ncbi:potassium/sodium hyperpolarization-activated cyclic nucleotide-gated channel 2-like [Diabrotica virgifera virgifera]|uniref:Cyclic nucleotide-binding domain-containing protein n=1 Tax=Diabrotica virgifera virgifera TaxID=50390 RepID=A0ABM5KP36_DIAVI|nr:potassium/sodium hyperpolarization-activated cyclic nucleotide-gated channel 2-like [Diabrotica virgifera virgifera]
MDRSSYSGKLRRSQTCLTQEQILHSQTDEKDVVAYIFNSGLFIELRRWYYYQLTINSKHPMTQKYYKSSSARKHEETRHLTNYRRTIHPFSMMNLCWEFLMAWVYLYMFCVTFFSTLFISDDYLQLFHIRRGVGDIIYVIDMLRCFFEGYYDNVLHKTILKHKQIALRYIKTYFIIDLIALTPNLSLLLFVTTKNPYVIYMRCFGLFRIVRIKRLLNAFELIKNYRNYTSYHFKAIKAFLIYVLVVMFLYSGMLILTYYNDIYTEYKIENNSQIDFLSATLVLFLVSEGLEPLYNHILVVLVTIGIFCGFFIHLFLHAQVFQVWNKYFSARSRNEDLMTQFKEYISYRGLPLKIKEKIMVYFNFKFENYFYNERHINYLVSTTLREQIMINLVHNYLTKADILKTLPRNILVKLVTKLRSEIFLPDDIIVLAGKPASSMYFVYYGTLAVYNATGLEIAHIDDGDCFGERDMLINETRTNTVIAITSCELFNLTKSDLFNVLDKTPEYFEYVVEASIRRFPMI